MLLLCGTLPENFRLPLPSLRRWPHRTLAVYRRPLRHGQLQPGAQAGDG
jgi:hypothetical protein